MTTELTTDVATALTQLERVDALDTLTNTQLVTLSDALDDPVALWLLNHKRVNTRRAYVRALRDFVLWLARERGKSDLTAVTFADALLYREALSADDRVGGRLRGSSIIAQLHALSSLSAQLVTLGRIAVNPWAAVELPDTSDRKPQRAWRADELFAFFAAIPQPRAQRTPSRALQYARDHALFWLLFRNGLRINEACGARLGDVERIEDVWALHIREHGRDDQHVKRGDERLTALKPETVATLTAYLERRGVVLGDATSSTTRSSSSEAGAVASGTRQWAELPLFAQVKHTRACEPTALTARQVARLMRQYGDAAGLDAALLHPHAARRTAITTLAWRETSIGALKSFSGHKTTRALEVYIDAARDVRDNPALRMPY